MDLANTSDSWWNGVKARRGAAATSTDQYGSVYSLRDLKNVIQFFSCDQTNSVMDNTFIISARKLRIFRYKLLPSCRSCTLKMGAKLRSEIQYINTSVHRVACGKKTALFKLTNVSTQSHK